jgi:hypothetical protein
LKLAIEKSEEYIWGDKVKIISKEEILKQYEVSGKIMYDATLDGNYKANNREGAKLTAIFKQFEKDRSLAQECILELSKSDNVVVKTEAAAYCLALRENIELGEKILDEIANDKNNGIFGFNAKMTLKVWRKNGELLIYQR